MTQELRPGKNRFKTFVIKLAFFFLGRAAQIVSKVDPDIQNETARWPENYLILYKVLPKGPRMALARNRQGHLEYRGSKVREEEADLTVTIKNIKSAFMVFTFQMGMNQAYAQNRLSVRGDIPTAMSQMRVLNLVQAYMLPEFVVKPVIMKMPKIRPVKKHFCRGLIYFFGIPFGI